MVTVEDVVEVDDGGGGERICLGKMERRPLSSGLERCVGSNQVRHRGSRAASSPSMSLSSSSSDDPSVMGFDRFVMVGDRGETSSSSSESTITFSETPSEPGA